MKGIDKWSLCGLALLGFAALAFGGDAEGLAQKNYQHNRVLDSSAALTMTLINRSGAQKIRKLESLTKLRADGGNMRLLTFSYPADVKGTMTLLIEQPSRDDDMWIYLPALKKVRRLVAQNKRDSFVGSDLTFGDILGHKPEDWEFTVKDDDVVDGVPVTVLEAKPKTAQISKNTGYSMRRMWVAKDTFAALRTDYWDEAGQLLKTVTVHDVRLVDSERSKTQYMQIDADNLLAGSRTRMEFSDFKANIGAKDSQFLPSSLEPQ